MDNNVFVFVFVFVNIGLFKEIRQVIIQNEREHQKLELLALRWYPNSIFREGGSDSLKLHSDKFSHFHRFLDTFIFFCPFVAMVTKAIYAENVPTFVLSIALILLHVVDGALKTQIYIYWFCCTDLVEDVTATLYLCVCVCVCVCV